MSSPLRPGSSATSTAKHSSTEPEHSTIQMDTDATNTPEGQNATNEFSPEQAAALSRASDALLNLFTSETSALDKFTASYWREMVLVKAEMDVKVMEALEAKDLWADKEAVYLKKIASLEKRVKELEAALKERDA